ncbi:cation diffusion facilitator family transporter [Companilactobacillus alimentarius]|uniref:Cation transporter n=1 Tax=Companilactobacillus alimentarius DSM 20249 TaxID=1423720 RepID=A0A2K9HL79_9LACO|nr:cation diffusion facilitator family transporter [Companilactobacillus alimentarius]AUI72667.1 cation transporter [Companilactobacillus alimentarius DSM 20249]KRK75644.1 cation efflux protein [Companilactobacillus alimentarius DSM 20249]GEO45408.1 cobalt transporter [Companilactobacillus alimentarius]
MDHEKVTGKRFFYVTALNVIITITEFIGGFFSGSLGLISDAFHNLEDSLSIVISFVANVIGQKKNDVQKTFGYKRAEILAAFVNSIILVVITVIMVFESFRRLSQPQEINGRLMMIVSIIGLLANFISMWILFAGSKDNLNIKATFLHMLSDTLSSVGVFVASIFVILFNWIWVDPLITIVIALWLLKEAFSVVFETINILMEASPKIDLDAVQEAILTVPEIVKVHHVHVWMIDENHIMLDAHINVKKTCNVSQLDSIYDVVDKMLNDKFHITHVTLQAECSRGLDNSLID